MFNIFKKPILLLFIFSIFSVGISFYRFEIKKEFTVYTDEDSIPGAVSILSSLGSDFK